MMTNAENKAVRKKNRLQEYDYSLPGIYFITICTKEHRNYFWESVGASSARPQEVCLSAHGKIVDEAIKSIHGYYSVISVDHYVVMPNHVHLLIQINADEYGRRMPSPSVSRIVQHMKGYVTKQIGFSVWQKSFHDHIVRGKQDYEKILDYIENNPSKWSEDKFYIEL